MEAERDLGHSRTQRLAADDRIVDRRRGWKDAGKERMQRAAIIGVISACASARMGASVMTMTVSVIGAGLVVTGVGNGSLGSRVSL